MGKLRSVSGRQIRRILEQHGFQEVRRRGSHVVMQRRTDSGTITVPVPDHDPVAIRTSNPSFDRAVCLACSSRADIEAPA
ncbi:MAG TPA: type II toxin-antitoxin system HicA family toxin [Thermoanaerobaculia bacterium]|nr:type II toxin-antitoxin system HicA family toxin [Thermoanaerobaculia bacterium]